MIIDEEIVIEKAEQYRDSGKWKQTENNLSLLNKFRKEYPLRQDPQKIDTLRKEEVFASSREDTFSYWISHKLRPLGKVHLVSDKPWKNALKHFNSFKQLLRIAVNRNKTLSEKMDAPWNEIPLWEKNDRILPKKIIAYYYPKEVIPIFKTKHLREFIEILGAEWERKERAKEHYGKDFKHLSLGQKHEILNNLLLDFKDKYTIMQDWHPAHFMKFYLILKEKSSPSKKETKKHDRERGENREEIIKKMIINNLSLIDPNLEIKEIDFSTDIGIIDLLCKDEQGNFVIVKIGKEQPADEVLGKVTRYLGWMKENYSQDTRAILLLKNADKHLKYAVRAVNHLSLKTYDITIEISDLAS